MTYCIIKEGKLLLFEGSNESDIFKSVPSYPGQHIEWHLKMKEASKSAIIASDQDEVKEALWGFSVHNWKEEENEGKILPLKGYKIELKEQLKDSYIDKFGDMRYNDFEKLAILIKE